MRSGKHRIKCGNTKGSSIVEVLAAFVILMIGLGFFATAAYTAMSVTNDCVAIRKLRGEVVEKHYRDPGAGDVFYEGGAKAIAVENGKRDSFILPGNMKELKLPEEEGAERVYSLYFFSRE